MVFTAEYDVVSWAGAVGVGAALIGSGILSKGFLATEYKLVGNEGEEFVECLSSLSAWVDGEVGIEVGDG